MQAPRAGVPPGRLVIHQRPQREPKILCPHSLPHFRGKSKGQSALSGPVALLLDEDPSHTAKASLREAEGMTLLWLPKRLPKLNPMDTLKGQGKDVISAHQQYTTIEEHVDRLLSHLRGLTNQEALHTSGVLSKKFWLKGALSN